MNYFITLLFLLLSASANAISHNDYIWFGILLFMVIYALVKKMVHKKDLKMFGLFMLIYVVYMLARNLMVTGLESKFLISDMLFMPKYCLLAFVYCIILREKLMDSIVKVTVHLTIISLVIYAFQVTGFADVIYSFSESLGLPKANTIPGYTNFIIFSFTKGLHDYRNSGFVWEPGAFGAFLIVALFFNFLRNKFTFDKKAYILIIAIITTFSTTDYLALIFLLFLAYRYRVPKVNLWVILLIPAFIILFITVPFLWQKIADIYIDDMKGLDHMREISRYNRIHNEQIPLNRFASMIYLWDNVGANLILGLSNKYDVIIDKVYNVNISNGIFDFLAKFGVMGFLFQLYGYIKFCKNWLKTNEYIVYAVLVLLAVSFGEPILFLPLFLIFVFLPFISVDLTSVTKRSSAALDSIYNERAASV